MAFTVGNIVIENVKAFRELISLEIKQIPNEHPYAKVEYTVLSGSKESEVLKGLDNTLIKISIKSETEYQVLFTGYFDNVVVKKSFDDDYIHIVAAIYSSSILLDQEEKNRSFQDISKTYQSIISQVATENGAGFIQWNEGESTRLSMPVIQYKETNWQFIKRMASCSNSCVIVDTSTERARIHIGMPSGKSTMLFTAFYKCGLSPLYNELGGKKAGLSASNYLYYEVTVEADLEIGAQVFFRNHHLYVYSKITRLEQEKLMYTYQLVPEAYFFVKQIYNDFFIGHTILGDVLAQNAETLKLDLKLSDDVHDSAHAYPYNWTPETGNFSYCMPQKGTTVSLYFADNTESSAKVINCIRKNGATAPKMENTQNKRFTTEHGMVMDLDMDKLFFSTPVPEGGDAYSSLDFEDKKAITFLTKGSLSIIADEEITVECNILSMTAFSKISIDEYADIAPAAYFSMFNEFNIHGDISEINCSECYSDYAIIQDKPESGEGLVKLKIGLGIAATIIGTAVGIGLAALFFPLTAGIIVGAAVAGIAAGGFALYSMRQEEKQGGEGYSVTQVMANCGFQACTAAFTDVAGGGMLTKFGKLKDAGKATKFMNFALKHDKLFTASVNAAGNMATQAEGNVFTGKNPTQGLLEAGAASFIWDGGMNLLGAGKAKLGSKLTSKYNNKVVNFLFKKEAQKTSAQVAHKAAQEELENAKKVYKDAEEAYRKLRNAKGASRKALNQANREAQAARKALLQNSIYGSKPSMLNALQQNVDVAADRVARSDEIFDNSVSLFTKGRQVAVNNVSGLYLRGEATSYMDGMLPDYGGMSDEGSGMSSGAAGAAEGVGTGGNDGGKPIPPTPEEKRVDANGNTRDATWQLCTGVDTFVEDVYPSGVEIEGIHD